MRVGSGGAEAFGTDYLPAEVEVKSIDFVSSHDIAAPFLVAITAE